MKIDEVVVRAGVLGDLLDRILVAHDAPTAAVRAADWAFYRFVTAQVAVRDRSGGTVPATLARGLLEEAAYWDWALADGVGAQWCHRATAIEYERLSSTADPEDAIWLRWVFPPGASVANGGEGLPNQTDVVRRLGHGLDDRILAPLSIGGLFGAYKLIEVLTHGGPSAALLLNSPGGCEMRNSLSAALLHVAGAGAAAIIDCHLNLESEERECLIRSAHDLARAASAVHQLSVGEPTTMRRAKSKSGPVMAVQSDIDTMPPADIFTQEAATRFVAVTEEFRRAVSLLGSPEPDAFGYLGACTFALAQAHLRIVRGIVEDTLGRALLPFAARALFEEGARWGWLRESVKVSQDGQSARALLGDARHHLVEARRWMVSEGIPNRLVDELLTGTQVLVDAPVDSSRMPSMDEMLAVAYPTRPDRTASAGPIYSILSQFVHSTPIAALHLQRDHFPSLSAPMYAVAVEAACHGYLSIATSVTAVAFGERSKSLLPFLERQREAFGNVCYATSSAHFLD